MTIQGKLAKLLKGVLNLTLFPEKNVLPANRLEKLQDWCEMALTHRCNQRCFFCYEDGRDLVSEPDIEEVKRLLDETLKKARQVCFCGKEILLRKDILEIIRYAEGIGLKTSVFSNGQAFEHRELVGELVEAGCTCGVISFHFPDADTFARGARVNQKGFLRTGAVSGQGYGRAWEDSVHG